MKAYTVFVDIELPRDRVVELFDDPDNLFEWQPGLQSFERVSGEPGQPGATSKLVYQNGKRSVELIEVLEKRQLPEEFHGRYEWPGGHNSLENYFHELGPDRTRWESRCTYHFSSIPMKLMGFFASGMFKKQNQKWLQHFKDFCENGTDVREQG